MTDVNYNIIENLENWARQHGHNLGDLAQVWLLSHPEVSSVITGATRLEQMQENAKAADWELSPDETEEVNQILRGK